MVLFLSLFLYIYISTYLSTYLSIYLPLSFFLPSCNNFIILYKIRRNTMATFSINSSFPVLSFHQHEQQWSAYM